MRNILPITIAFILLSSFLLFRHNTSFVSAELAGHVVISEVQIGGSTADDEFVELYNPTNNAIDISSWSIQRETTGGTFARKNFEALASIPAHGYYLIAHTDYDGSVTEDLVHSTFTLASTGTTVFLVNDQVTLTTGDEVSIVDKVAIGVNALDAEGTSFATIPTNDASIERKPGETSPTGGNGEDTDNNSADFALRTTSEPQNAASATETPAEVTPSVTPTPTEGPTSTPTPTGEPTNTPTPTGELTQTPTPTPTEQVTVTPTPTPSEQPTGTPTQTPTGTPTSTPTHTTTPTPTSGPTSTPTTTPSATPTTTPAGTPTVTPTPTPFSHIIGVFPLGKSVLVCTQTFRPVSIGWWKLYVPRISCERVALPH